mmetsp:Transcript_72049/g.150540  ORF Transcript_72049/g.150540 Transcript_72049/m.150540 type:complete len:105 (+) Transcript_72049:19-333(+)
MMRVVGSVKRPDLRKDYVPPHQLTGDELPLDVFAAMSLVLGLIGLILRHKIASWATLFCAVASIARVKKSEFDLRLTVCTITFAGMGLLMVYGNKQPPWMTLGK